MLSIVACVLSMSTVYGEGAKVPASTTIIDKAEKAIVAPAYSNGATIYPLTCHSDFVHGYNVEIASLDKIWWVVDETFYATGYKVVLNKEVTEIIAPPERKNANTITPLKRY